MNKEQSDLIEEEEVNLLEFIQVFWSKKIAIAKTGLATGIVFVLFTYLMPVRYEATSTFLPEASNELDLGSASQLIKQYGALMGSSTSFSGDASISPMLYPKIINSLNFKLDLLQSKIHIPSEKITCTYYEYYIDHYDLSIFEIITKYSIKLPYTIKKILRKNPTDIQDLEDPILSLTKEEEIVLEILSEEIEVFIEDETGIISVTTNFPDAYTAAQINQLVSNKLIDYLNEYYTRKLTSDLKFMEEQLSRAEMDYEEKEIELSNFKQSNANVTSFHIASKREKLESEYQMRFEVYSTIYQQIQQLKIKLQEQKRVLSTLNPVRVPIEKASPQRGLTGIIGAFLGSAFYCGLIFIRSKYFKMFFR